MPQLYAANTGGRNPRGGNPVSDLGEGYAFWKCTTCDVTGKNNIVKGKIKCWNCNSSKHVEFTRSVTYKKG